MSAHPRKLHRNYVLTTPALADSAEDISNLAFGFMASKALFAGLHVDVFTRLSRGPKTVEDLSGESSIPVNRLRILMQALAAVGLVSSDEDRYQNAPGSELFLVRGAKYDFGDYLRYQIDQQMYGHLEQLNSCIDGQLDEDAVASYAHWMSDPEQATLYSEAQHSGSLGPGRSLARTVDLSGAKQLLDIGGGTGAMTIQLCAAYPQLDATIIDFPNVAEIGWRFVSEASLVNRVRYIPGNALTVEWPTGQDAILMSYLFSGVPGESIADLIQRAFDSLNPGGHYMVHDFMVDDYGGGPSLAALWQLQHMAFTPDARSVSHGWLERYMVGVGFRDVTIQELVPGMTTLVYARKPDASSTSV
ncbi:MAG: methyltransferase [Chromatiales bacterium]|jgi:2-hydroxy-4-(methylsulfanyl)butanoate S-methyltransferase|nr:methyltransferase [Chromatiales bacterium]